MAERGPIGWRRAASGWLGVLLGLGLAQAVGAQTIRTNLEWSPSDAAALGRNPPYVENPLSGDPFTTSLSAYQARRASCAADPECEPTLVRAANITLTAYGWHCGAARGGGHAPLDPVDACCKLHDLRSWSKPARTCDPSLDGSAEITVMDACGIMMCLASHAPSDWSAFPDAEKARDFILQGFAGLCLAGCGSAVQLDSDCDGHLDDVDNCFCDGVSSAGAICPRSPNPGQSDTDGDLLGNRCDCDFDQDGACDIDDFSAFLPDFASGSDGGSGTDMTADGAVHIDDFNLFLPGFVRGEPGPGRAERCQDALTCGNGVCEPPAENCGVSLLGCAADCGLCESGRRCVEDGDCQSGICDNRFTCIDCKSNGQACLTDDVCCTGICNNAFQCASCRSNGQACLSHGVCCSGHCNTLFQCASCRSFGQACSSDGQCCSGNCNRLGSCGL